MGYQAHNSIVNFKRDIAADCMRDIYVRGKYRDVIRRLDATLEDIKPAVLNKKQRLNDAGVTNQWPALCKVAGQVFCNAFSFRMRDIT